MTTWALTDYRVNDTSWEARAHRLRIFIALRYGGSNVDFAKEAEMNPSQVSQILGGHVKNPGADLVTKFAKAGLSIDWWLTGRGPMDFIDRTIIVYEHELPAELTGSIDLADFAAYLRDRHQQEGQHKAGTVKKTKH